MKINFLFGIITLILSFSSVLAATTGDPLLDLFAGTDFSETATTNSANEILPLPATEDIQPIEPAIPQTPAPQTTVTQTTSKTTNVFIEREIIPSYNYAAAIGKLPYSAQSKTYLAETGPKEIVLVSGILAIFLSFLIFQRKQNVLDSK
ncbi:hypothetical protein K9N08_02065 [Candidatus Gracilibacteria bacterium]|nr:hypothetical protein [Candidatus Gracilibacteria bacterium]MCF7856322.1 hypothetical protein [Candidatus Gracilibacteria bacterium]MCF7896677.1 hypothetical protein [Candidatus Gracilibacteria bacterium]